jgi:PAS domain S-box-containing protein
MRNNYYWLFRTKVLLVSFILFATILLVIAHNLYNNRKIELKATIQNNLKAIAELKATEIHNWLNERLTDANVLSHSNFYPDLNIFFDKKSDTFSRLKDRMTIVQRHYKYKNVILLDLNKNVLLVTNDSLTEITETVRQSLNEKLDDNAQFKLFESEVSHKIILDFYCAVMNYNRETIGYLVLRADPNEYLFPTMNRWPVITKTSETLLLERNGDSIRPVNNLKLRPGSALKSTTSIKETNVAGVNAALGGPHLFEGVDYRRVPVLSYWVPIEGTEWKLIAKVDSEEILEPLRNQAWAFGIIMSMLLLFLASVILLIKNLYQKSYIKRLYDAELERRMLVGHFDYLIKNANDIILLANDLGVIVEANDAAIRAYRIERNDMLGSPLSRLGEFTKRERRDTTAKIYESVHYRSDGSSFPVEINEQTMDVEGSKFFQAIIRDITDRKLAVEALRKSEERLNYAQEIANMGSWSLDMVTHELKWSRNYYKLMGLDLSGDAPSNDHFNKIVHPDDLYLIDEKLDEILKTRKPASVDLRLVMPDGSIKWVQNNIVPEFNGDNLVALQGVNIDITEKKIKDEEINKLSLAVEQSPILVVITDLSGDIVYVNPAFELTTGYSRLEVIGKNPRILNSGQMAASFYKELWETVTAGQEWKGELINKKKNGDHYWENMSITPIHDSSGKITNYLAIKQDISLSKANEQKILELNAGLEQKVTERTMQLTHTNEKLAREIEERIAIEEALIIKSGELESFFTVALDLLCIANTSGQFIKVNKAWEKTLGYSADELENRLFLDFVHPDDQQATLDVIGQLSEQNPVLKFTNRYKTRNNEYKYIEWHGAPHGDRIYAAARDITERKRKEDFELELLQLSAQLTGIKSSDIKEAIHISLERIGRYTGTDRTFIFEIDPGEETFSNTYEWNIDPDKVRMSPKRNIPISKYPNWWKVLQSGKYIATTDINEFPDTWAAEKEILKQYNDKSILVIPMFSENKLIGYGGLATVHERKEFSIEEINLLSIWCRMLTSLLNNYHAESLLELTRKNYETFFNTLDDFLWVLGKEGNIIHFNNTALNRLEYSLEELVGKSILMVHPADRREEAGKILNKLLSGSSEIFSIPLMSKSGKVIPVETKAIPGFWNGEPVIFKASKDISQIKLSEEKFSTAFQSNSAMMAISHYDDGKYVDVNNAFLEVLGYTREEVIGKTGRELGLYLDPDSRKEILDQLERNKTINKIEVPLRTKSGGRKTGLMSAGIIYIGDKKCLLTVNIDISDRKKMEEQLKTAQDEANRANLAKSEFLSRMSHELRTPMNSILGFAQLLEMGELNAGQKKGVKHILNSGKHLLDLINEVLEISRIEAGKMSLSPEPIQVSGIIHEMMEIVWPLVKERHLTIDLIGSNINQLYIHADRQRLKQVLLNLINNAIKYNKTGGSIKIDTSLMPVNERGFTPVRISVTDTGIGIPSEKISLLFNPFERIGAEQSTTEGTGLGLAVVKKLVDAMNGTVGVESIPGEGSTFWIELPLTDSQLKQFDSSENYNDFDNSLANRAGTILYIEDNVSNIELVEQILIAHCNNIRLISNMNGNEAVRMAMEYHPDLILLDLNLPGMHGSEVLELLRSNENTGKIPVVIISADATAQQLEKLKKKGADYYLTKPLDVKELLRMINKTIRN